MTIRSHAAGLERKGSIPVGKRPIVRRELPQPPRIKVVGVELKISRTMCEASIEENPKKLVEDKVCVQSR